MRAHSRSSQTSAHFGCWIRWICVHTCVVCVYIWKCFVWQRHQCTFGWEHDRKFLFASESATFYLCACLFALRHLFRTSTCAFGTVTRCTRRPGRRQRHRHRCWATSSDVIMLCDSSSSIAVRRTAMTNRQRSMSIIIGWSINAGGSGRVGIK